MAAAAKQGSPGAGEELRIEFRHHDAAQDAMVAARVVIAASRLMDKSVPDWV